MCNHSFCESKNEGGAADQQECNETIVCENCWEETTREQYESDYGCHNCNLGPNSHNGDSGIQCDCCERSFSQDCMWDNAYSKLIWKYGLDTHPVADEWTMMCPHCQDDEDLVDMYNQEADRIALEYFNTQPVRG